LRYNDRVPRLETTDQILTELAKGLTSAAALAQRSGQSLSAISRALRELIHNGRAIRIGRTRGATYGRRRAVSDVGSAWPLYQIDREGEIKELGMLYALAGDQYYFVASMDAIKQGFRTAGISDGLPYFLHDQRPDGFLGRAVPARYPGLQLPARVSDWTDDHYLRYFTQHGSNAVSDLILGEHPLNEYLLARTHRLVIQATDRERRYPPLVQQVMQGGLPGSSAHGEHPKFTALIDGPGGPHHVLVKFSPEINSAVGRRWSDLLIAEHHAHELLREALLPACNSRVLVSADRTYLEVERFDRYGREGRGGVTSLMAIDLTIHAELDNWVAAARRMRANHSIDAATLEHIRLIATFGELIANTDRHFGNLAFHDDYSGSFRLAPVYDMLPMLFAPLNEQILPRVYAVPAPTANSQSVWRQALALALRYWQLLAEDQRISEDFRAISATCRAAIQAYR
jgi:hypothetical protein